MQTFRQEIEAALGQALYSVSVVKNLIEDNPEEFNKLVDKDQSVSDRYKAFVEMLVK